MPAQPDHKTLSLLTLLVDLDPVRRTGPANPAISALCCDPDKAQLNSLFIAMPRWHINAHRVIDGHEHIDQAIQVGARAVVCEQLPEHRSEGISYVQVGDSMAALTALAGAWFDHPSRSLTLIGITGTNGKTTIATSLYRLFGLLGHRCGLISTIENRIGEEVVSTTRTTPDILEIHGLMQRMVDQGCTHCFMEVSSHGIDQNRIGGLAFDAAIFTNLGLDHLDYHPDFDHYARTKKRFFDTLSDTAFALINADDKYGSYMSADCPARVYEYSLENDKAPYRGNILDNRVTGLLLELNDQSVQCRLNGRFNAYNLLAIHACAQRLGESEPPCLEALAQLAPVEGRLEWVQSDHGITGIVDYAHTPDALQAVLKAIDAIKPPHGRVLTVLGCGGNRDQAKRPHMASVAFQNSHLVILTSDNPRYEDPVEIIADMKRGLTDEQANQTTTVLDRPQAIRQACQWANSGDVVLVAGKGHERFQEFNGIKQPCHDMSILQDALGLNESGLNA